MGFKDFLNRLFFPPMAQIKVKPPVAVVVNDPPAVPTGLRATPSTSNVVLAWSANVDSDLAGYRVYRDSTKISGASLLVSATHTDATGTPGTVYVYGVTAVDSVGQESAPVAVSAARVSLDTIAPPAPAGLVATPSTSGISLAWTANASDTTNYRVYAAPGSTGPFTLLTTLSHPSGVSYAHTAASEGAITYYRVTAVDGAGNESQASSTNATRPLSAPITPVAPPAPINFSATPSTTGIKLTWTMPTNSQVVTFRVYRDIGSGFVLASTSAWTAPSATDTTTAPGVRVYYRVTAVNAAGLEGPYASTSAAKIVVDATAPKAPTVVTTTVATSGVTLNWAANAETDLAGYNVYRSSSSSTGYTKLNSSLLTVRTYVDTTATAGAVSYYRVTAVDASANESTTTQVSATRPLVVPLPETPGQTFEIIELGTQAPALVVVDAYSLLVGDWLDNEVRWDFGDPTGRYNECRGASQSHRYDAAGQYTISATVERADGTSVTVRRVVSIAASTRTIVTVNTYAGLVAALATGTNKEIRVTANIDVQQALMPHCNNLWLRSYGGRYTLNRLQDEVGGNCIINSSDTLTYQVMIDGFHLDSPQSIETFGTGKVFAEGWNCRGKACCMRDISYANITTFLPMNSNSRGHRFEDCYDSPSVLRGNFVFGAGSHHVWAGCRCGRSTQESGFRSSNPRFTKFVAHDMVLSRPNRTKNIWEIRQGQYGHLYDSSVAGSVARWGQDQGDIQDPPQLCSYMKMEDCIIEDDSLLVRAGLKHAVFRNNIFRKSTGPNIEINHFNDGASRLETQDIRFEHNTIINVGTDYACLRCDSIPPGMTWIGNRFYAPLLKVRSTHCMFEAKNGTLANLYARKNVWPANAEAVQHRLAGSLISQATWLSLTNSGDIQSNEAINLTTFQPAGTVGNIAPSTAGTRRDRNGVARASSNRAAGAVNS